MIPLNGACGSLSSENTNVHLKYLILSSFMAILTGVGAQIRIPVFPVPFTLQTFFVLLAGSLLGSFWGACSMLVYLALGLIGLPVFAGSSGIATAASPTFGYLLGFPLCAYWIGKRIAGRPDETITPRFTILILLEGQLWIFLLGVLYLWGVTNILLNKELPVVNALMAGFVLFIPSAIIKALAASWITTRLKKTVKVRIP